MRRLLPLLLVTACAPAVTGPGSPLPDVMATLPAPREVGVVRAVVIGDQGTGTEVQRRVARGMAEVCAREGCDLGVALGDNFYPAGPKDPTSPLFRERFADVYGGLGVPFLMIPGNHDESWLVGGDGADAAGADAQVAYGRLNPAWVMPARTYRAPVGDVVEFFAVDTTPLAAYLPSIRPEERPGGPWDAAQRAWLTGALKSSQARWKLVLGHHPLFSSGNHGDAGAYDRLPFAWQRGEAVKTLYGVACGTADLLLSGHEHALALFSPQPECAGTWTAISGAAGEVGGGKRGPRVSTFTAFAQPGFLWLKASAGELTLKFYTVAADGHATLTHTQVLTKP